MAEITAGARGVCGVPTRDGFTMGFTCVHVPSRDESVSVVCAFVWSREEMRPLYVHKTNKNEEETYGSNPTQEWEGARGTGSQRVLIGYTPDQHHGSKCMCHESALSGEDDTEGVDGVASRGIFGRSTESRSLSAAASVPMSLGNASGRSNGRLPVLRDGGTQAHDIERALRDEGTARDCDARLFLL